MIVGRIVDDWSAVLGTSGDIRDLISGRAWQVTAQDGTGYALKRLSTQFRSPIRRFADEARVLGYLRQRELPVAVPVINDVGCVYSADTDGTPYSLTPMLPSDDGHGRPLAQASLYEDIGATIARMHIALAEYPYRIDSSLEGRGPMTADGVTDVWLRLANGLRPAVFDELCRRTGDWGELCQRAMQGPSVQRVHGDVHGGNILTYGGRASGILDIDHLPIAPRSYDLGYYAAFCVHARLDVQECRSSLSADVGREVGSLLTGYGSVSPLDADEISALPAMSLVVALRLLDHFLTYERRTERSWIETASWIAEHPDLLGRYVR